VINLNLLKLEGVIFHQVPQNKGADSKETPVLSDAEQPTSSRLEFYLRDQIVATFSRSRQRVEPDEDQDSTLPTACIDLLVPSNGKAIDDVNAFVEFSRGAAQLLYERQRGNAPDGLLVVGRGTVGDKAVICLAKLEQQAGLSFEVVEQDGGQVVQVALEDGLVLTDDTAVFKAAIFTLAGTKKARTLDGIVSDEQSGKVYEAPVSAYWLRTFLGCKYANSADVQTRAFVKAITDVINHDIADFADRDLAHSALTAELHNNKTAIDPSDWIETNLPLPVQDKAIQRLADAGAPTTAFPKGQEVVEHAPKNTWFEFSDGTRLKVPIDHEVQLDKGTEDNVDVLTVRGKIVRIR
jgi:hypothetical protein